MKAQASQSPAARTWAILRRNPLALGAGGTLFLLLIVALGAPLLAPVPASYGESVLVPPSSAHWFGTDPLGRDVFAEVIWGTQQSMLVAAAASAIASVAGTAIALLGAYARWLDGAVGMLVDLMLALPVLPLMILVAALVGPSTGMTIVVIAAFAWPEVTRLVRSQALTIVGMPYIDAARLMAASGWWITRKHLLPAVAPVVWVSVVVTASRAILAAAGIAFLGLGDPTSWSWGRILYDAQAAGALGSAWWLTVFPSVAILALVLTTTLASIAYNDARNPITRQQLRPSVATEGAR